MVASVKIWRPPLPIWLWPAAVGGRDALTDLAVTGMTERSKVGLIQPEVRALAIRDDVVDESGGRDAPKPLALDAKRSPAQDRDPHPSPCGRLVEPVGLRLVTIIRSTLLRLAQLGKRPAWMPRASAVGRLSDRGTTRVRANPRRSPHIYGLPLLGSS